VFPKIGVPQNGWFIMENPIKMIWGYHNFRKHPYGHTFFGGFPTLGAKKKNTSHLGEELGGKNFVA